MLGLSSGGAVAVHESRYGSQGTDFIMDNVACEGHEASLDLCDHVEVHDCGSSEVAGVICGGPGGVSLAGGPDNYSGSVLYNHRPIW